MTVSSILYDAKLTTLKIGEAITSPTTSSSVYSQITDDVTGGVTAWFKDVTISAVDRPVELVGFLGQDANSLPNQSLEKKTHNFVKISGKLNFSPVDTDKSILGVLSGASGTTVGTGTRYQFGSLTDKAIGIEFTDAGDSKVIQLALNNAMITKISDITQSAGTHVEVMFEAVCVIADFYEWVDAS